MLLLLGALLLTFTIGALATMPWFYRRSRIPQHATRLAKDVLKDVDGEETPEPPAIKVDGWGEAVEPASVHSRKRWRRVTATAKVVRGLKAYFQIIEKQTPVVKQSVRREAYRLAKEIEGLDERQISQIAPVAAALYWAPSSAEILEAQIEADYPSRERQEARERRYTSSVFQWITGRQPVSFE